MYNQLENKKKVCGIKQVKKALKEGNVKEIYVANDADERLIMPIVEQCKNADISVVEINSMEILGKLCDIDVGCSIVAVYE